MKLAFVSGPYTNASLWQQKQNIQAAERIAVLLWQMGYAVICPHANTHFFDGAIKYETFLEGDYIILSKCDVIIMMPTWRQSRGANGEHEYALKHGIKFSTGTPISSRFLNLQMAESEGVEPSTHIKGALD
jgi:hypothetical protein